MNGPNTSTKPQKLSDLILKGKRKQDPIIRFLQTLILNIRDMDM